VSIYNAIAQSGSQAGAGFGDYVRNKYNVRQDELRNRMAQEDRDYARSRNVIADQRYDAERGARDSDQSREFKLEGMRKAAVLPPEQREAALRAWQAFGVQNGIQGADEPFDMAELNPLLDALAESEAVSQSPKIGNVTPGDYTPSSLSRFNETGDYSVLQRYEPAQVTMIGDVPHTFDKVSGRWRPGQIDRGDGPAEVTPEVVAGNAGTVAGGRQAGEAAIKQSNDAIERIGKLRTSMANIDDAINALESGASTGAIVSKLPTIRAASVELENVRGRMGLDVIGSTTFGALSEAELRFALDTAIPTRLDPPELKTWLQRKKKAQEKLSVELERAAVYLGRPGNTPAGYLEYLRNQPPQEQDDTVTFDDGTTVEFK